MLVGVSLESWFNIQYTRFRAPNAADISMGRATMAGKEGRKTGRKEGRKRERRGPTEEGQEEDWFIAV